METVNCNLCGSSRYAVAYVKPDELFFPDEFFRVVVCDSCGLGFVNPRPTIDEMGKYYPAPYYEYFFMYHSDHLKRYAAEAQYLSALEHISPNPRLLDVGCANGDFPRFMQARGWRVEGVEISTAAQPIRDFKVYRTWFPDIPLNEPCFDAVTAWAVLEHVHDPMQYFTKAAQLLRSGGLFVFQVPNFESLACRRLLAEDVPRHLYFFTEATVRRYLDKTGFVLERAQFDKDIYRMMPRHWLHYSLHRLSGRALTWPLPETYSEFVKHRHLRPGVAALLRFGLRSPISLLDAALIPLIEQVEIWRHTYGNVTYVARKA